MFPDEVGGSFVFMVDGIFYYYLLNILLRVNISTISEIPPLCILCSLHGVSAYSSYLD